MRSAFGRHFGYVTIRPLAREDSVLYFPPEAFGPFRVLHQIGAGTLGPVFRAYEAGRERLVAIKVFRLDATPEQSQAFVLELEQLIARDLGHPAVAAPIAVGFEGTAAYLAMEYAVGESLDVTRASSPMPLGEAVPIVEAIAEAIDACADKGVSHQLLHPRDVVISADGVRVTGFGVAEALARIGMRMPVRRPYAAPEGPSDVYSMAAIAYELISGRRMTPGGWDELSAENGPALRDAFAAALSPDPQARFARAGEFAANLRYAASMAAGETTETRHLLADFDRFVDEGPDLQLEQPPPFPESWSAQPPKPFQAVEPGRPGSHRGGWLALLLLVGLAVILSAGYVMRSRSSSAPAAQPEEAVRPVEATTVNLPPASNTETAPAAAPEPAAVPPAPALPAPAPSRPASGATPSPARPIVVSGRLLVRSTPAEATVVVNGQPRGKTPLTLRDLALGSYTIRVARDGFATEDRQVRLTANQPSASIAIPLKPAPPKDASGVGRVLVESRPPGARVFVNDRLVGSTPLAIPELPAGPAAVRIEMDGYQRWATTVRVNAGEQTRVGASLDKK